MYRRSYRLFRLFSRGVSYLQNIYEAATSQWNNSSAQRLKILKIFLCLFTGFIFLLTIKLMLGISGHSVKSLVAKPSGDMFEALSLLASAYSISKLTNRKFQILWSDFAQSSQFFEVFDSQNVFFSSIESHFSNSFDANQVIMYEMRKEFDCSKVNLRILKDQNQFIMISEALILETPQFIDFYIQFYQTLPIKKEIAQKLQENYQTNFKNATKVVGIDFRGIGQEGQKISNEDFIQKIEKIQPIDPTAKFYLSGISAVDFLSLKNQFHRFQFVSSHDILNSNSDNSGVTDLLEWIIIQKTDYLIGLSQSIFSDEAAILTKLKKKINIGFPVNRIYPKIIDVIQATTAQEPFEFPNRNQNEKFLIVKCVSGWGNRISVMASGYALAKILNRTFIVDWIRTEHFDANFDDLFIEPKLLYLKKLSTLKYLIDQQNSKLVDDSTLFSFYQSVEWTGDPKLNKKRDCILKDQAVVFYVNSWMEMIPCGIDFQEYAKFFLEFLHSLVPVEEIQREVDEFKSRYDFSKNIVGIHYRTFKNDTAPQWAPPYITPFEDILNLMIEYKKANQDAKFFVATDDRESISKFKESLNGDIINLSIQQVSHEVNGLKQAICEWVLLSNTKFIYGTHKSTFSDTAAILTRDHRKIEVGISVGPWEIDRKFLHRLNVFLGNESYDSTCAL